MPELVVDSLSFRYPGAAIPALDGVSLAIERGEMVLVTGPSGCGKSTLALALTGLVPNRIWGQMTGGVWFRGDAVARLEPHQIAQRVGMVFQDPSSQLVCPEVEAEVAFGPENLGLDRAEIRRRVEGALAITGMARLRRAVTASLSGGEKQRLAIAATLAMEPDALVLDEPCSDLDPVGAAEVLGILRRLNRERRMTVVLIEHRIDEVIPWVDRVVLLDRGRLVIDAPARKAFADPAPWHSLAVAVPEMVQLGQGLPEVFGDTPPLSAGEAVDALTGTPWAGRLACHPASRPRPTDDVHGGAAAVRWHRVRLDYGPRTVLSDVSLEVRAGEWLALVGPNGSGKTSLLELAMGFQAPTTGVVEVAERPVRVGSVSRQAAHLGYLFQSADTMLFTPTVEQELLFTLRHRKRGRGHRRTGSAVEQAAVAALLSLVGLDDRRRSDPFSLSAGQRQRLAIAALLVESPPTLILDEPTTGQDEGHSRALLGFLDELASTAGMTYLMVTHDMRVVARHATRMAVLAEGRLIADGPPENVFACAEVLESAHLVAPPAAEVHRRLAPGTAAVCLDIATLLTGLGADVAAATGSCRTPVDVTAPSDRWSPPA